MKKVDPWSREQEFARGVLRSSPKPEKCLLFAVGEGSRFLSFVCYTPRSGQMFLCQTPGRRPQRITGRVVNTDRGVGRSP